MADSVQKKNRNPNFIAMNVCKDCKNYITVCIMYVQYTCACNPFVAFASKVDCSQQSENTLFSIDVGKILCTLPSQMRLLKHPQQ